MGDGREILVAALASFLLLAGVVLVGSRSLTSAAPAAPGLVIESPSLKLCNLIPRDLRTY